jgi:YVTN family beta-propeller protein
VGSGPELPSGTVTFLFTDIEGSTSLLKHLGERYAEALAEHQRILRDAFAAHGGHEIDTQGDAFFVAFRRAKDAVAAAISGQRALAEHEWPDGTELRVRMGLHTGEPTVGGERYVGLGVHRAARVSAVGHGGQVLLSQTTRELLRDDPLPNVTLRDLGAHKLKDLDEPERIYQLVAPSLIREFPPLKTPTRRPDRRKLVAAGAALVAVAGAALGVLITQGGGSTAGASNTVAANAVGVVDSKSGKIAAQVPVGVAPGGAATGWSAIWVSNANDGTVSRIDEFTNDVRQTIQVGHGPAGIAVGGGAVWVANGLDGTVSRIDPTTNQVVQTITVGNGASGVAFGEGSVWVANSADGTVSRIEPSTGHVTRTLAATVGATGIAVAFRRVWVVSPSTGVLVSLDPTTGAVREQVGVGVDPEAVAAGAGSIWVANRATGTLSKVDPRTAAVTDTIRVGRSPLAVVAGARAVWVANAGDGTLSHIDPASDAVVKTVSLANPPEGLAANPRYVYVAVRSSGAEHRGGALSVIGVGPASIDPVGCCNSGAAVLLPITNDGLVAFRRVGGVEGTQLVPDLAVSLPAPTDGGRTYTFTLRPGIRYSSGRLVEPQDIRWELERVLGSKGSSSQPYYSGIVGALRCHPGKRCDLSSGIVVDPVARTITFHLAAPDPDFLTKLAWPASFAVPAGTQLRDVGAHPLPATGPYMVASYSNKTGAVRLVRNPRFREWSQDAQPGGFVDSISLRGVANGAVASDVRAVERGRADLALSLAPPLTKQQLETLSTTHPSQLRINTEFATRYFFLNTRVRPFDDVRVRRAVNVAFDRQAFAALLGPAYEPTCQILPPGFPSYRRTCPYGSGGLGDLAKARSQVRAAGAKGTPVTVWIPAPVADQGRFMVSVLDSLGLRARLKTVRPVPDIGAYFNKILDPRVHAQTGYIGWQSSYPSDFDFLEGEFGCSAFPQQGGGPWHFCDHALDAQMAHAAAVQAQEPAAAIALWQKVEQEILGQAPVVPTYNAENVDFVSKRVGNYEYNPQWGVLLDQLWVK